MFVFTAFIYVLVSLLLGLFLIGLSLKMVFLTLIIPVINAQIVSSQISNDLPLRLVLGITGAIIILVCIRYLQAVASRSRKDQAISFESPHGRISITLYAIEDMIKKMMEERRDLSHIRPKVTPKKKQIMILVRGNLTTEMNLLELTQQIQEEIQVKLQKLIGDNKEITVCVEIKKVTFDKKRAVAVDADEESEPAIPFRNY